MEDQFALPIPPRAAASTSLFVKKIDVDELFGEYSYSLSIDNPVVDFSKLLILYGDNGSGKTTILRLIFHLLSPAMDRDHRTSLGRISFRRFAVELGDGTVVAAERPEGSLLGTYTLLVHRPDSGTAEDVR